MKATFYYRLSIEHPDFDWDDMPSDAIRACIERNGGTVRQAMSSVSVLDIDKDEGAAAVARSTVTFTGDDELIPLIRIAYPDAAIYRHAE